MSGCLPLITASLEPMVLQWFPLFQGIAAIVETEISGVV